MRGLEAGLPGFPVQSKPTTRVMSALSESLLTSHPPIARKAHPRDPMAGVGHWGALAEESEARVFVLLGSSWLQWVGGSSYPFRSDKDSQLLLALGYYILPCRVP